MLVTDEEVVVGVDVCVLVVLVGEDVLLPVPAGGVAVMLRLTPALLQRFWAKDITPEEEKRRIHMSVSAYLLLACPSHRSL